MKVIKRNGSEVVFDISKIITAITKANNAVDGLGAPVAGHSDGPVGLTGA